MIFNIWFILMNRIGIFGGTFNPIHIGHLAIAQMAQEQMHLDRVIFVPSNIPPHKKGPYILPALHRYRMVRLAIRGNSSFAISDFEIKRGKKSYTIDTIGYFKKRFPPMAKLFFIVGADTLPHLKDWRYIEDVVKIVKFIVVNRPGYKKISIKFNYHFVAMPGIDLSSTILRRRIARAKTIRYYVPDNVFRYIEKNKLFKK